MMDVKNISFCLVLKKKKGGTVIIVTDLGFGVFGEILLRVNMNHRVTATLIRSGTQGVQ